MLFLFKKYTSPLLFPLPLSMTLLLIGVLLLWFSKKQRWGRITVTLGLLILAVSSCNPFPGMLLGTLERQYPAYAPRRAAPVPVRWIVVLSGGFSDDTRLPATDRLSRATVARLIEGIRLSRLYPAARLLLSGGSAFGTQRGEAFCMREAAVQLGVDPGKITVESKTRDTEEQAVAVQQIVGKEPLILVTSASHLPRSLALFRKQGMDPLPAPADHLVKRGEPATLRALYPGAENLHLMTTAIYEYLGIAWAKLRDKG